MYLYNPSVKFISLPPLKNNIPIQGCVSQPQITLSPFHYRNKIPS